MGNLGSERPLTDEERGRIRTLNRRAWSATLVGTGVVLLVFGAAGTLFILWLLSALANSRTPS